ncbi:hypothetical protein D3C87_528400 [compost metagenome]
MVLRLIIDLLCFGERLEGLTRGVSCQQINERSLMIFDELTRLLNVHQGLSLALRGFDRVAQAGVIALDFDELTIQLAEQLDAWHDGRLNVRFCFVE